MSNINILNQLNDNENIHKSYLEDNTNILSGGNVNLLLDHYKHTNNITMVDYYNNQSSGGNVDKYADHYAKRLVTNHPITIKTVNFYGKKLISKIGSESVGGGLSSYTNSIKKYANALQKNIKGNVVNHLNNIKKVAKKKY